MVSLREAALYAKLSEDHHREAAQSLSKFGHKLRCEPGEAIMDIGCGPGSVMTDIILPSLHPLFSILVGIDISENMVKYAKARWSGESRLHFVVLDAAEPEPQVVQNALPVTQFHKIFSFYALQWVKDLRQLAQNLHSLLVPGGQAFLVLVVNSAIYSVWDTLAKSSKWETYFRGVKLPFNEYQYMTNPGQVFTGCLEDAGLQVPLCHIQFHKDAFSSNTDSDKDKIAKLRSVDPLVSLIPDDMKDDYMADALDHTKRLVGPRGAVDYTSMTVICERPSVSSD